ncbi:peptide ABC transporter permease [Halothiobacillus diazotrophicus]|uniref:Peptide ABC transporter permease n=1 Tax=Halothiobacillus diazotrophicus TaxID=1860122 RepID=A0A191ZKU0_9GAMM|nr:peptide ABC transporter permease [Halothiobacillus diazotrophicus]
MQTPGRRAWARFKGHWRGYVSLWIFAVLFVLSLGAELIANNRPLLIEYQGQFYFPLWRAYPETTFGGDFKTNADYTDPYVIGKIREHGWLWRAPIPFSYDTIDYYNPAPNPAPPNARHWLGTDDRGRDVAARLIYGFRISVLFAFALTAIGMVVGMLAGAVQGYLGGKVDLAMQRFIEVWGSLPELYLLIIFSSIFAPSIGLLLILLSLFGWIGLSDYVRAEFLKGRNLEYVRAARSLGVSGPRIMFRHLMPNALTPVITFLPFRVSGAILALTSLDFLGLGVPPSTPSLGELLSQGKNNVDAWWLSLTTFGVLVGTLMLLIFIGEAVRAAFDTRQK